MPMFDVLYNITETRVKTVKAESEHEAEDIIKNMLDKELRNAFYLETGDPLVLQVTEVE